MSSGIEILKALLVVYFRIAELNHISKKQARELFDEQDKKFNQNTPDKLGDPDDLYSPMNLGDA